MERDPTPNLASAFEGLTSADWQVRLRAVEQLGAARAATAVEAVAALLNDPNPRIREAAGDALAQIGDSAIPILIQMLPMKQGNYYGRFRARDSLIKIGSSAQPALIEVVRQGRNDEWRTAALSIVAEFRDAGNIPLLIDSLADKSLHHVAVSGLVKLGESALPALEPLLDHENTLVKQGAIAVLGKLQVPHVVPRLMSQLNNPDTMQVAAVALGNLGGTAAAAAVETLIGILRQEDPDLRAVVIDVLAHDRFRVYRRNSDFIHLLVEIVKNPAEDIRLRGSALYHAIHALRDEQLLPLFCVVLDERPQTPLIAQVLEWLHETTVYDEPTLARVIEVASDPSSKHSYNAELVVLHLARYHTPADPVPHALLERVLTLSRHEKAHLRALAVMGLSGLRSPDTIPALIERLDDGAAYQLNVGDNDEQPVYETVTIGQLAVQALERIGTPNALAALETWRKGSDQQ